MTKPKPLPPLELLLERFEYDAETGHLYYNNTSRNLAGYDTGRGWLRVKINGKHYRVARIAWKMHYGIDPPEGLDIDHINRNRSDNRIANLRLVTRKENIANTVRPELKGLRITKKSRAIWLVYPDGKEKLYNTVIAAALDNGLDNSNLLKVLKGLAKSSKGYTARYAD